MSNSKRTFLITGCAGFFSSHLIEHILRNTEDDIIGVDNLSYAGTLDRLRDINLPASNHPLAAQHSPLEFSRFRLLGWDFRLPAEPNLVKELEAVTHVIHAGGATHVDSSITDPMSFVEANVVGTTNVLELARKLPNLELFHFCNTDEVFNSPKDFDSPGFKETDVHSPGNPYAATKSAAYQMVQAYANTYKLPCINTYLMNLFGERQHFEKFIPKVINSCLSGEKVFIHATPDLKQAGRRTYIHCRNAAAAFLFLYNEQPWLATPISKVSSYNIVGEMEVDNLEMSKFIEQVIATVDPSSGLNYEMVDFHSSRPGHDILYRLDGSKMAGLGWKLPKTFHESLRKTILWYLDNPEWLS